MIIIRMIIIRMIIIRMIIIRMIIMISIRMKTRIIITIIKYIDKKNEEVASLKNFSLIFYNSVNKLWNCSSSTWAKVRFPFTPVNEKAIR
jgi:hypothetical protein